MTAWKLALSILTTDFGHLSEQIRAAEHAGVEYIHADVMDEHFVPTITIGPLLVDALRHITRLTITTSSTMKKTPLQRLPPGE